MAHSRHTTAHGRDAPGYTELMLLVGLRMHSHEARRRQGQLPCHKPHDTDDLLTAMIMAPVSSEGFHQDQHHDVRVDRHSRRPPSACKPSPRTSCNGKSQAATD
uniref:Uncharacterized protein n=1 Tax=Oryza glumipatula TaxID=40148 RepID=A0A0E0BTV7_9ORYZ